MHFLPALALLALVGCKPTPQALGDDARAPAEDKAPIPAKIEASLPSGPRWESLVYRLRVRSSPKKDSQIVGHLAKGEIVVEIEQSKKTETVSGKTGRWIKVQTQSKTTGWVFSPYLTKR